MPFMLLGRVFTARHGLAGGWVTAYRIRYAAVLVLILAPFVEAQGGRALLSDRCCQSRDHPGRLSAPAAP